MGNRSGAIDALRILGIVAIVAGHTWDNNPVRVGLYTWHVPLFFFLTGYLWRARRPVSEEASKRAISLLVPYFVWLVVIGSLFEGWLYLRHEFHPGGLLNLAWGGNHLGRPFSAFWFVTALFLAAVVLRLLQALPIWAVTVFALAGLGAAYTSAEQLAEIPMSAGVAWPALVFLLAGHGFRHIRHRIAAPLALAGALTSAGALLAVTGLAAPFDIKQADFGTPGLSVLMAVMLCAGMLLLAELLFSRLGALANKLATTLALGGFMVVLSHAVLLWVLGVSADGSVVAFAAALLVPWIAALAIGRTPLAPYFLGTPPITRTPVAALS